MARAISFNSNDLQTSSILTAVISIESWPTRLLNVSSIAHGNKSIISGSIFPSKQGFIKGKIVGSGINDTDSKIDTFKKYFNGIEKNLDIDYNGTTRRFIATASSVNIDRPEGLSYADFEVTFIINKPFSSDTSLTNAITASARTLATYSDSYTFLGTAERQSPIFTVEYTAISGGTAKTVSIGNANTGQQLSVTRNWATNDVLIINTQDLSVTVNGIDIDFSGAFPDFELGAQTIDYSDNFTSRTFDYDVQYYKRYS